MFQLLFHRHAASLLFLLKRYRIVSFIVAYNQLFTRAYAKNEVHLPYIHLFTFSLKMCDTITSSIVI
ncbi:hypothetical protein [Paenibacillus sp. Soil750]|uniref:hypothetical protein n=1 Tax=Paenibacillus sp. Soil750 TaxID=1736398 RepID=UPI003FA74155